MDQDAEVLQEFIVESTENLDELDRAFVALESDPTDRERIASIFRTIHTIKGTAGFLGCGHLEALAHAGEEVLSLLRDGKRPLTPAITTELLTMVDGIRRVLGRLETAGSEGNEAFADIILRLKAIRTDGAPPAAKTAPAEAAARSESVRDDEAEDAPSQAEGGRGEPHAAVDATVRVDVGLLDKLMNLVGELVLARNQILQAGAVGRDAPFVSAAQRLNLITTELQEGVMKTRMRPIGSVWNKFPRVVRDLSLACGKEVRLDLDGAETELDRTILEAIKDPLTHIVRNAVDHGIETAAIRTAQGKPPAGVISLRAFHEGGKVNIEIADDGKGIDIERVRAKAIERAVVTAERAARMSDRELTALVFAPGFSTAEAVSNISGRGVGMDVVKTNVERIGGTVELTSRVGVGTTIKVKIPLTLAIIPALVVQLGTERYAIPQVNLLELVRLDGDQLRTEIEHIHGVRVMRLRGNLLPLVSLQQVLGGGEPETTGDLLSVVVVQADDRPFGLIVDGVTDTEEIVVKPLGRELKGISAFAGATIMGDGRVALILDVVGLAQRADILSEVRERAHALTSKGTQLEGRNDSRHALLLFERGGGRRLALPLAMVARLEEFPRESIEHAGTRQVVQYRGDILPLVTLDEVLGTHEDAKSGEGPLQVVVFSDEGRSIGLVVDRILDIVQEEFALKKTGARSGVRGTAVIQDRVTELLDVQHALRACADGP